MDPPRPNRYPLLAIADRVATDLAAIAVAVPLIVELFVPELPPGCGMTPERNALMLGLTFLALRFGLKGAWWFLKIFNEVAEGLLDSKAGPPGGIRADPTAPDTSPRTSTP